jgi:hypothetical protein
VVVSTEGEFAMEQPYSVVADWLSKFHTWPEGIQALWLVALAVTVLGVTWIVMRGLRDTVDAWRRHGEATPCGVPKEWNGPILSYDGRRLKVSEQEVPLLSPSPSSSACPADPRLDPAPSYHRLVMPGLDPGIHALASRRT